MATKMIEQRLRQLAAEQECQVEVRAKAIPLRTNIHPFARHWSPVVAAGLLALMLLSAISGLIALISAVR